MTFAKLCAILALTLLMTFISFQSSEARPPSEDICNIDIYPINQTGKPIHVQHTQVRVYLDSFARAEGYVEVSSDEYTAVKPRERSRIEARQTRKYESLVIIRQYGEKIERHIPYACGDGDNNGYSVPVRLVVRKDRIGIYVPSGVPVLRPRPKD